MAGTDAINRRIDTLIDTLTSALAPRAKSLIVTVLGDTLEPRGGAFWLGGLIDLLAPFGINQRLVRTSVLRLSREDWLTARPVGRRSHYRLTGFGRQQIVDSQRRIYAGPRRIWDGRWHLVLTGLGAIEGPRRARLRRELRWLGFGGLGPNIFAHPEADPDALRHTLQALGLQREVAVMHATGVALFGAAPTYELLGRAWDLDELARGYAGFIERFAPFRGRVADVASVPEAAFGLRVLLMHEYRRVLLRDPALPVELLPARWAGAEAWALARDLYAALFEASEAHLSAVVTTARGALPPADPALGDRFAASDDDPRRGTRDAV